MTRQRAVTTEAGVAGRNRPHIVESDKLVLLESISLAGKKVRLLSTLTSARKRINKLRQCDLTSGNDHAIQSFEDLRIEMIIYCVEMIVITIIIIITWREIDNC